MDPLLRRCDTTSHTRTSCRTQTSQWRPLSSPQSNSHPTSQGLSCGALEPLATPVSRLPPPAARCKALQSPSTRTAVASPPGELTRARPMHTGTPPSMLAAHVSAPSILIGCAQRPPNYLSRFARWLLEGLSRFVRLRSLHGRGGKAPPGWRHGDASSPCRQRKNGWKTPRRSGEKRHRLRVASPPAT